MATFAEALHFMRITPGSSALDVLLRASRSADEDTASFFILAADFIVNPTSFRKLRVLAEMFIPAKSKYSLNLTTAARTAGVAGLLGISAQSLKEGTGFNDAQAALDVITAGFEASYFQLLRRGWDADTRGTLTSADLQRLRAVRDDMGAGWYLAN
jgi:hypothetical protein